MTNLNTALRLYTKGEHGFPVRNDAAVLDHFGEADGPSILAQVSSLVSEICSLTPDWKTHSLGSGIAWAKETMRERHPDLDDEALQMLGWSFSYNWK